MVLLPSAFSRGLGINRLLEHSKAQRREAFTSRTFALCPVLSIGYVHTGTTSVAAVL